MSEITTRLGWTIKSQDATAWIQSRDEMITTYIYWAPSYLRVGVAVRISKSDLRRRLDVHIFTATKTFRLRPFVMNFMILDPIPI